MAINKSNWAWQKGTYRSYNLKFRLATDHDVIQYLDKQANVLKNYGVCEIEGGEDQ